MIRWLHFHIILLVVFHLILLKTTTVFLRILNRSLACLVSVHFYFQIIYFVLFNFCITFYHWFPIENTFIPVICLFPGMWKWAGQYCKRICFFLYDSITLLLAFIHCGIISGREFWPPKQSSSKCPHLFSF